MPGPRHAVIMSSYNRPTMISKAIRSVRFQSRPFQLIVADDGSNEETRAAIKVAFGGDLKCEVMYSERPRDGAFIDPCVRAVTCINDAIARVKDSVEFMHYLPDDDWYAAARFAAFERFFDANEHADVAFGRMKYVENDQEVGELFHDRVLSEPFARVDHGQFCHRRKCFELAPQWPVEAGNYAFDAGYFHRLVDAGFSFYPIPEVVNYKRRHEKNLQNTGLDSIDTRE